MRLVLAVLAAALVATPVATGGRPSIPKAQWIKQADAICKAANAKLNAISFPKGDPTKATGKTIHRWIAPIGQVASELRAEVVALEKLPAPSPGAAFAATKLGLVEKAASALADAAAAARSGNVAAFSKSLRLSDKYGTASDAGTKKFGLKVCGQ